LEYLQLDDIDSSVESLWVDDDLHVQGAFLDDPLNGWEADPEVVGVEHVKLFDRLEVFDVVLRDLGYFQKPQMILKKRLGKIGTTQQAWARLVNQGLNNT
jgi:hypothetical protein